MGRWNNAAATAPLWITGLILIVAGIGLLFATRRAMRP